MKVVVIGDLHCRSIWKDIIAKEEFDKVVFLGDYTCPKKDVKFDDPTDACGFLYEILDYKDQNPDKVILLRGNHDLSSLGYHWAECYPQDHHKVAEYWRTNDVKNWFLKNTQWIYQIPDTNIVCSHAGIGKYFFNKVYEKLDKPNLSYIDIINEINNIEPCELFAFTSCKLSDYSGESSTHPCTWIRPYPLFMTGLENVINVVGHTPVTNHIVNFKDEFIKQDETGVNFDKNPNVWCCDALGLDEPEYLVIENGEFKICKV